jgi:hypothetical protein
VPDLGRRLVVAHLARDGLTLADKQRINRALLESGASIGEMNCVRKHLSRIKGGRLAAACAPARVVTLAISDVPGDDPSVIASGPTVPDATTCADALEILARYRIDVPPPVRQALQSGALETPKLKMAPLPGIQCTWWPHPGRRWRRQRPWRAGRGWRPTSCPTRWKANPARWGVCTRHWRRRGVARPAV